MADHVLQQARAALFTVLDTAAGMQATVHKGRRTVFAYAELPAVNIRSVDEEIEPASLHANPVQLRRATLVLDINCAAVDDVEPELFTVQAQVEKAVAANPTLGGVVRDLALTSSRQDEIDGDDAEYIIERRTLIFNFMAVTRAASPDVVV
ncbi:MAG: hypothetical protein ACEQSH_00505 [Bacteroidia bacterium]